ncbi:MAG: hypothetical protein KKE23_02945 [Nanoarchaeota archaeon]|nr:hypothetical protein [Nanoarchaeota archaeon]
MTPKIPICKKCPVCGSTRLSKISDSMRCKKCNYIYEGGKIEGFKTFEIE